MARERGLLRRADAVVAITEGFRPLLREWGVPDAQIHVVENWAPLEEMPPRPKDQPVGSRPSGWPTSASCSTRARSG